MALKDVFQTMKHEGYVIKRLDQYLMQLSVTDNDRALNVNAPSSIGSCLRARYYSRIQAPADVNAIEPRTRRIFDNGSKVHERLQGYLKAEGMLLLDEAPLYNEQYNIQGHTDGILRISPSEVAILEIKSINSRGYNELKKEKPEHRMQGLTYVYCTEQHRLYLRERYKSEEDFQKSKHIRATIYRKLYSYMTDGHKYTRAEKIAFQVRLFLQLDEILFHTDTPVTKCIFLYENKDTQDLNEFTVSTTEPQSKQIMGEILSDCAFVNDCVEQGSIPNREGTSKSSQCCRWCKYKTECWN